ncbi:MAG: hypothetical protein LUF32_09685 [Clostridiales bacterium]|nr:hypothetical protein [Clostridiales bacterium]
MQINIRFLKKRMSGGERIRQITASLDRNEYEKIKEQARKNEMDTPKYIYSLLNYGMQDDSWMQNK